MRPLGHVPIVIRSPRRPALQPTPPEPSASCVSHMANIRYWKAARPPEKELAAAFVGVVNQGIPSATADIVTRSLQRSASPRHPAPTNNRALTYAGREQPLVVVNQSLKSSWQSRQHPAPRKRTARCLLGSRVLLPINMSPNPSFQ